MPTYRLAGQHLHIPCPVSELQSFEIKAGAEREKPAIRSFSFPGNEVRKLISRVEGWVANAQRVVEVYGSKSGFLLKAAGCGEYFVTPHGEAIGKSDWQSDLRQIDREILLGPVIVLALALRNIWSLHASAVMVNENVIVFLGESGMGKSTLAAYLSKQSIWRLVADDILPVKDENGLQVLPHFPQLKLPSTQQPGIGLPEKLPLKTVCVLDSAKVDELPKLQKMTAMQTVQALLGHIAGTRMFSAELLAKHLQFSTQAAAQITTYKLTYPHRREALPLVKELLEKINL
jgi:hypothetical protein